MSGCRLLILFTIVAIGLAGCGGSTPTGTSLPTATNVPTSAPAATAATSATAAATAAAAGPFAHTACANGADLTGQTVTFYHLVDLSDRPAEFGQPMQAGLEDAAAYFNAHGGVCGAKLTNAFPDPAAPYEAVAEYHRLLTASPRPALIGLYDSGNAELLRDSFAKDQIPALGIRVGSERALYGADGQTPGWIFATNPLYTDQLGAFCQFVAQHPQQYPRPAIGYLSWDGSFGDAAYKPETIAYCGALGVKVLDKPLYFSQDATDIHALVQNLVDAGANILYTNTLGQGTALIAKTLVEMGLQKTLPVGAVNWAMDASVGLLGQDTPGADGLPSTNGLVGSLPLRTWAEMDQPGIQLLAEQAELHQRPLALRNNFYILGWASTDLYIELYIQTGNRVGFDHISGAEMKKTLENIVYAPLGGVEHIDFQGGARRALPADRIVQMAFLGRDGKNPAGPNNPMLLVNEGGQQSPVPLLVPLSDFGPAPDLRPGGADVPAAPVATPGPAISITSPLLFGSDRSGNVELYRMSADGSGLVNLTNNPAMDWGPAVSPDGTRIVFSSDRDGNSEVYLMQADGSGQTRLTNNPADDGGPFGWTPDGHTIIFKTNRDGNYQIYAMQADGSGQRNISKSQTNDELFALSPDGQQIVYASDGGLYLMQADGSQRKQLTDDFGIFPSWSPDGKQIAFNSSREGNDEIYVINADGSGETRLTNNPANDTQPVWLSDGQHLSFTSDRDHNQEIYVMNTDGSDPTRLTHDPAADGGDNGVFWLAGAAPR